jgi:F-type H+-transporting ATPase subunit b
MKNKWKFLSFSLVILAVIAVSLQLTGGEALAEEAGGDWRKSYDVVMLWVNFGILAFVLVKFGKDPVMRFLRIRRDEVAAEIRDLENEKALVTEKINEARQAMAASDARFAEMKSAILRMGEKRRQDLINDAEQESRFMMELAQQKVGGYILAAKRAFKEQLIDAAVNLALKRLPDHITDEDNQQMVDLYLDTVSQQTE